MPAYLLDRAQLLQIKEKMKNFYSYLNQGMSWNEFEVVARNYPHTGKFENHTPVNHDLDFYVQIRNDKHVYVLDTSQVLDYTYVTDDLECMDEFRVKSINERFEFSVENPSDKAYHENISR